MPLNSAADFGSAAPASTSATWPSVIELAVPLRDHERGEILRPLEAALEPDRTLLERAVHVADRRREILRAQRVHDLIDADARRREIGRTHVDVELRAVAADDVHLRHAADRAQLAGDRLIGELR